MEEGEEKEFKVIQFLFMWKGNHSFVTVLSVLYPRGGGEQGGRVFAS
jgi:hypothetical protein